jgi:hypothetical protein
MPAVSLYSTTFPPLVMALKNLAAVLAKGEAYAQERKIDPAVLLNDRLHPTMFALTRQVQIACDVAKGAAARLAGVENPAFPDDEATFEQLQARIARTIAFLMAQPEAAFDGAEDRMITLQAGGQTMQWHGSDYVASFVLPNVYFHCAMAYGLLRKSGVDLRKQDFLAGGLA